MKATCAACRAGPAGIDGHPHLRVHTLCADRMAFNCERCAAFWSRTSLPGRYLWARTPARQRLAGVHIPQRHDAAF